MARIIKNTTDLNAALNTAMLFAIKKMQQNVYEVIQDFIRQYYEEKVFVGNSAIPSLYDRTYQFFNSLVKSDIVKTPKGYSCSVYIDYESLDYYGHSGLDVITMINDGYHADPNMNNGVYETPRTIYAKGEFWDDSMELIEKTKLILNTFEEYMIKAGIPVTKK